MKNFAILFAMHCFISANAQSLTGSVKDEAGKAISSATISLLKAKDSSTIKFSVSDRGGNFTFSHVPEGNYFISITCVGYINAFSSSFIYKGGLHVVPVIILLNNKKEMANVTVQSSRSFIEMHLDRMVVNVDHHQPMPGQMFWKFWQSLLP
jgi:hypothetical protein